MKQLLYLMGLLVMSVLSQPARAQIGMGGTPHPSAVLDLQATNKGFYPPRLTTAQRKAITNAQPGMFVFDTEKGTFYLFDGQNWLPMAFQNPASLMPIDRTVSDGAVNDQFGFSVSISGDYALVGAYLDDIGANANQGSAYVFFRANGTWTQQAKLIADDGMDTDFFGFSVSLSGDYALIGASHNDIGANTNQGAAYVFVRSGTTWSQQTKLTASDGAAGDQFGNSVSISGDYALVGAMADEIGVISGQGSAYIYKRTANTFWVPESKLTASDGAANDQFGRSVSLSGDYALVGALNDDNGANVNQGSAYVFLRSGTTWGEQAKLIAGDGAAGDLFGVGVSISGDYALVGASQDAVGANVGQGSAYVFFRNGINWSQQAKFTALNGAANDFFGYSVSLSGDYAVVGAVSDNVGDNSDQGSAYLYKRVGVVWSFVRPIVDNAPANTQNGISVGLSNGSFIIGGSGFDAGKGKVSFGTVEN